MSGYSRLIKSIQIYTESIYLFSPGINWEFFYLIEKKGKLIKRYDFHNILFRFVKLSIFVLPNQHVYIGCATSAQMASLK